MVQGFRVTLVFESLVGSWSLEPEVLSTKGGGPRSEPSSLAPHTSLGIVQSRRVIAIAIVALRVRLVLLGKGFRARTKAQMHYFELFRVLL